MIDADKYKNNNYKHSDITEKIIKEAYFVYNNLGFGFLEKVYENALFKRLKGINLKVQQQCPIKVSFQDEIVGDYCADLLVENCVIVELKAVEKFHDVFEVQLVNYLQATQVEVGLLINFGKKLEIKRKVFTKQRNS